MDVAQVDNAIHTAKCSDYRLWKFDLASRASQSSPLVRAGRRSHPPVAGATGQSRTWQKGSEYVDAPFADLEALRAAHGVAENGMTMIVVTHDMGFARVVGTHLVVMDQGVVVEEGRPTEVFANPRHDRTRAFLSRIL